MMRRFQTGLLFLLLVTAVQSVRAADWPQYGGPQRNGISPETGLLQEWPADGPPLLWKITDLGLGYSPVSVVGERVYTLAYRDKYEFAIALDRGTGKEVWAANLGVAREAHAMAFLRQRQPLVAGGRLYAFTTAGQLVCLGTDQGQELWRKRYIEDFKGRSSPFGWTDYPLLDGERLICTPGGAEIFHVALQRDTGEVLWKAALPEERPSHSPMVIAEVGQQRLYVQNLGTALVGISAADGKLLWRYRGVSSGTANLATPAVLGDRVFAISGYGTGCTLLQQVPGAGTVEVKVVYHDKKFQNLHGGIVPLKDHIYAGHGYGFSSNLPTCYDWQKGTVVWQHKGPGQGGVATIAADGRLYLRFADGLLVLAEASPAGFKERGQFRPPHRSTFPAWSAPVIAHGRLFLRDHQALLCYDLRAQPPRKVPLEQKGEKPGQPEAVFVPSPPEVVEKMLELARVTKDDTVYDLGCGDGRIVLTAAKKYQARAVGIELDPELVQQARAAVRQQGLQERVVIQQGDLFAADCRLATVIALYLLPHLNARLLPQLNKLKPGTRIVSHAFEIPGIQPDQVVQVRSRDGLQEYTLYLWVTPLRPRR